MRPLVLADQAVDVRATHLKVQEALPNGNRTSRQLRQFRELERFKSDFLRPNPRNSRNWRLVSHWNLPLAKATLPVDSKNIVSNYTAIFFDLCPKNRFNMSQIIDGRCCTNVDAGTEALIAMDDNDGSTDLEAFFKAQYERIARVIAGVIRDPARAEELAVEVFLKWDRHPSAHGEKANGWLYRTAIRAALNRLRRELRRNRYETLFASISANVRHVSPSPEEIKVAKEEQEQVRTVLAAVKQRDAELLLLRSSGFSYDEIASTLHLNPASVGTLLSRAEQLFRKEFIRRYGG